MANRYLLPPKGSKEAAIPLDHELMFSGMRFFCEGETVFVEEADRSSRMLNIGETIEINGKIFTLSDTQVRPEPLPNLDPLTGYFIETIDSGIRYTLNFGANGLIIGSAYGNPETDITPFGQVSVSAQHASLTYKDGRIFIRDLGSANGTKVDGVRVTPGQDVELKVGESAVALGTFQFTLRKKELAPKETLIIPETPTEPATPTSEERAEDWREMRIPKKHLIGAASALGALVLALTLFLTIFSSSSAEKMVKHPEEKLKEALAPYPEIVPSYNSHTGSLFLTGHVLTSVDHKELLYILKNLSFVGKIEDYSVIDELVWKSMNSLLATYPEWQGITIHSPKPGRFVIRGYLETSEAKEKLTEYMNMNFPYLDRLENGVVVEKNLETQIGSMLLESGLNNVQYSLSDGSLTLSGAIGKSQEGKLKELISKLNSLTGISDVMSLVIPISGDTGVTDISGSYPVSGYALRGKTTESVQIKGGIYTKGSVIDGMRITELSENMILLEKDGLKFQIKYNQN